jgi:hypothetical protein
MPSETAWTKDVLAVAILLSSDEYMLLLRSVRSSSDVLKSLRKKSGTVVLSEVPLWLFTVNHLFDSLSIATEIDCTAVA